MADPITMAVAASAALKTVGGVVSGLSSASAASAQARLDTANAGIAGAQANEREEQVRRQGRQALGEQVADIAQNGIGFTQTTRDTMGQSAANVSMDALNARYAGDLQATNDLNDAAQQRAKARSTQIATWIGAGSNALQGVGSYLGAGGTMPGSGSPTLTSPFSLSVSPDPLSGLGTPSTDLPDFSGFSFGD